MCKQAFQSAYPVCGDFIYSYSLDFPIKNVTYLAFRKVHLYGDFRGQSLQFCSLDGTKKKNTGNYLPEMMSN